MSPLGDTPAANATRDVSDASAAEPLERALERLAAVDARGDARTKEMDVSFVAELLRRRVPATAPIDKISTAATSIPRSSAIAERIDTEKSDPGAERAGEQGKPTMTTTMITTYVVDGTDGELDGEGSGVKRADLMAETDGVGLEMTAQAEAARALGVNEATEKENGTGNDATLLGSVVLAISFPISSSNEMIAPLAR